MPNLKGWEIVIILALLLLLFGAKRLPDASRSLGRSLRIFKAETKGLRDDDKATDYDPRDADRASYDRQIGAVTPPPAMTPPPMAPPSMTPPPMAPPPVSGESTDPAQPRQP